VRCAAGREILFYGRPLDGAAVDAGADRDALCALDLESGAVRKLIESPPFRDWVFPLAATSDGMGALLQIAAGNLYRIVALDGSGSARPRPLFDITSLALNLDTDAHGTIYADLIEQPREILRLDPASGSGERIPIGNVATSANQEVLPLSDGRILVTTHIGGRHCVLAFTPEGGFAPLFETKEESDWPMALVGRELVELMLGSEPDRVVALASTRDGPIERRLEKLDAAGIISIAGSPNGRTVYYSANGQVSAIDLETQESRELHPGEAVAVDPAGEYIVVVLSEPARRRLIKLHLSDGRVEEILVPDEMPLANVPLASNAVARDGRIAVRVAPKDSWYWPTAILDPRSGRIERAWPDIDADMLSGGWTQDGRLVAAGWPTNGSLWRFVPEAP
jgi:hypothetical protein